MKLKISDDLSLPADSVTLTLVVYGGKGMGKTNLGSVLVEELTRARLRWAWLDPLGVSWGLRHSADGTGRGVECLILGGLHGDIPIEAAGGAAVADVVIEEPVNALIDFSRRPNGEMWSIADKIRFVTDYTLRLFQRQGETVNGRRREPMFQVLDEAARYIPQTIPAGEPMLARCVGAWNQLVEEGRNIGLGVGLLTQRSARMSKSVSELADAMIAFRTVGPNSLQAVLDWLGEHVEKARIKELGATVRSLERGHALVVSPGWLRFEGVVGVRMRTTFDSSATPKPGERARTAKGDGAKPDLAKIRERMAESIERNKARDPDELIRRNRELERQLKAKAPATTKPVEPKRVDVPALTDKQIERILAAHETNTAKLAKAGGRFISASATLTTANRELTEILRKLRNGHEKPAPVLVQRPAPAAPRVAPATKPRPAGARTGSDGIGPVEQRILDELAELHSIGVPEPDRVQLALFCGYTNARSGGFSEPLGRLQGAGLIAYPRPGYVSITDAGSERASAPGAVRTTAELQARIMSKLDTPRAKILRELIALYPQPIDRESLAARLGYANPRSGGFSEPLGSLQSLGLIQYPAPGQVVAKPVLFLE